MARTRVLTGITTSGTPHLGNYVGAIRPSVAASRRADVESFYFLADYHALIKVSEPARVQRSTLEIAAAWLACGLDPEAVWFYRQSDIPEIPELTWFLSCVAGKGVLNRAHAYKAAVDRNAAEGEDPDAGVTAGLFMYPVLMAADILLFDAQQVPVGRDQVQHIEMARDFGQRFNHLYGGGAAPFVLPEAAIEEQVATLPGLDGRKMSKSYDNTIPLFEGGAKGLKDAIARIVTDSKAPGEPKDPDSSSLVTIYDAFASAEQKAALRADLRAGLAWGEAKQRTVELIESQIGPMRARYEELMAHPERVEEALMAGAAKARAVAEPLIQQVREAVGLRKMLAVARPSAAAASTASRQALPVFKQYREADGRFYFKLSAANGAVLLQSQGLADGREAGGWVKRLKTEGSVALAGAPVEAIADRGALEAALADLLAAAAAENQA